MRGGNDVKMSAYYTRYIYIYISYIYIYIWTSCSGMADSNSFVAFIAKILKNLSLFLGYLVGL